MKHTLQNIGPYLVDWSSAELKDGSRSFRLTPLQLQILRLLVKARGRVVRKEVFHASVWKGGFVEDGSLSQTIFLLRKALGKLPTGAEMIETVPKKGYRLAAGAMLATAHGPAGGTDLRECLGLDGEDAYRLLVDSIEDYAIYILDRSGRVLTWNKGAEHSKGFVSDEVIGQHYSLFFVAEDIEARVPQHQLATAAKSGHYSGEGWRIRKNGERFWASFALTSLRDREGHVIGFAKVLRDLTESKRHEDALLRMEALLRNERDLLRAAAESSMDALFICEPVKNTDDEIEDFTYTYLNHNVEKLVSIPKALLLGARMCEHFPGMRQSSLFDAYKTVFLTGEPFFTETPIHLQSVNSERVRVRAVRFEEGVAITVSDIYERQVTG